MYSAITPRFPLNAELTFVLDVAAPLNEVAPLQYPCPARDWYKPMQDAGYSFGPRFQPLIEIEAMAGSRKSRATLSFAEPSSSFPQSHYSVHPVALDGCLQSGAPSLWQGNKSAVNAALVPSIIDELFINSRSAPASTGMAAASAQYAGAGSAGEPQNYKSSVTVHDMATKRNLIQIRGLGYHTLDTKEESPSQTYMQLTWKPDISSMSPEQLLAFFQQEKIEAEKTVYNPQKSLLDLLVHKKPLMNVVEFNMLSDPTSSWLEHVDHGPAMGVTYAEYHLAVRDAMTLLASQEEFGSSPHTKVSMLDINKVAAEPSTVAQDADLVILRVGHISLEESAQAIKSCGNILRDDGYILIIGPKDGPDNAGGDGAVGDLTIFGDVYSHWPDVLHSHGFEMPVKVHWDRSFSDVSTVTFLTHRWHTMEANAIVQDRSVNLVHLSDNAGRTAGACHALSALGVRLIDVHPPIEQFQKGQTILILDEMYSPVLSDVNTAQWDTIQRLFSSECSILWVTAGAQLQVSQARHSLIHGMARVVRAEDPSVKLITLDVESATSVMSHKAIAQVLSTMQSPLSSSNGVMEDEYVERSGIIYISRVQPDLPLMDFTKETNSGSTTVTQDLHNHPSCVRLMCHQPGMLDSLRFVEVAVGDLELPDDFVEVDMHAAGVNYKDVATCLGIVPENQYLLGLEGAGVIHRVGRQALASFHVGQRVLVYRRGSFGNKVQCPVEGVHPIPDWMSFEEAATLPVVYLAVIYGLFDLANIQRGQSVLIHSAAGGVGIAAIQICRYLGADIYTTVGNDGKRKFLMETFNVPDDRIFSSRDTQFASQILEKTGGKGVDIILNSLTGRLLDESWRIIADCGTMVELGKKDILDRSSLSMEPFNRNASYRAIDMSHASITRPTVAR